MVQVGTRRSLCAVGMLLRTSGQRCACAAVGESLAWDMPVGELWRWQEIGVRLFGFGMKAAG
jgi:hypothetical protein